MATEFLMPKLGLTMEEGTITEWLVADGATVEVGAAILRIETDKTETDVEAGAAGRLHVVGRAGDTFACGERIGWILGPDEAAPAAAGRGRRRRSRRSRRGDRRSRRRHSGSRRRCTAGESWRRRWRSDSPASVASTCAPSAAPAPATESWPPTSTA